VSTDGLGQQVGGSGGDDADRSGHETHGGDGGIAEISCIGVEKIEVGII
jgi:hypothetical protein